MGYLTTAELASIGIPSACLSGVSAPDQQAAIDAATATADGYIGTQYDVPLVSWGHDLRWCVARLAAYILITRRGYNPEANQAFRQGYDDAIAWLTDVSRGRVMLAATVAGVPTGGTSGAIPYVYSETLRGW